MRLISKLIDLGVNFKTEGRALLVSDLENTDLETCSLLKSNERAIWVAVQNAELRTRELIARLSGSRNRRKASGQPP